MSRFGSLGANAVAQIFQFEPDVVGILECQPFTSKWLINKEPRTRPVACSRAKNSEVSKAKKGRIEREIGRVVISEKHKNKGFLNSKKAISEALAWMRWSSRMP